LSLADGEQSRFTSPRISGSHVAGTAYIILALAHTLTYWFKLAAALPLPSIVRRDNADGSNYREERGCAGRTCSLRFYSPLGFTAALAVLAPIMRLYTIVKCNTVSYTIQYL